MKFDILKHKLVPHHEILKEKEVEKLLRTYNIRKENLPRILTTDPVVQAIGAKEGDVIKIVRESPTAGTSVAYRLVVSKGIE
ncbi:MAG: DNA-directed RNA polymerase subunit H [Thermoplasmata archaeon]|nr:MAG: DNA-directed RNA polymerase subunit H [Thermoplasmata archaeon]KAA0015166.1 MAG: DNA-directed RNA polymerase subunit H [Thermoplasmata archaeon]